MRDHLIVLFKYAAMFGNIIFILSMLYNAIDEEFKVTLIEKISVSPYGTFNNE
jgi:hypothetical protein